MRPLTRERREYARKKNFVYELDHHKCHICGKFVTKKEAQLDHIIPKALSGRDTTGVAPSDYWNLRIAHPKCNRKRSNAKIPGQLRLHLPKEWQDD